MNMILHWFGEKDDTVRLEHIRQIPGVRGIAGAYLTDISALITAG